MRKNGDMNTTDSSKVYNFYSTINGSQFNQPHEAYHSKFSELTSDRIARQPLIDGKKRLDRIRVNSGGNALKAQSALDNASKMMSV